MTIRFSNPAEVVTAQSATASSNEAAQNTAATNTDTTQRAAAKAAATNTTEAEGSHDTGKDSTPEPPTAGTQPHHEALTKLAEMRREIKIEMDAKNKAYAFISAAGLSEAYATFSEEFSDVKDWHAAAVALALNDNPDPSQLPHAPIVSATQRELIRRTDEIEATKKSLRKERALRGYYADLYGALYCTVADRLTPEDRERLREFNAKHYPKLVAQINNPKEEHPQQQAGEQDKSLLSLIDTPDKRKRFLNDFSTLRENLEGLFLFKDSPFKGMKTHPLHRIMETVNEVIGVLLERDERLTKYRTPEGIIVEVANTATPRG